MNCREKVVCEVCNKEIMRKNMLKHEKTINHLKLLGDETALNEKREKNKLYYENNRDKILKKGTEWRKITGYVKPPRLCKKCNYLDNNIFLFNFS